MKSTDERPVEQVWRRHEGDAMRAQKGREAVPDPDWSLPELSRDSRDLVMEFYDWWQANKLPNDTTEAAFDSWCTARWQTPLVPAAKGLLFHHVKQIQRHHQPVPVKIITHGCMVYADDGSVDSLRTVQTIAEENGFLPELREEEPAPKEAKKVAPAVVVADPPLPELRLPYAEPEEGMPSWATPVSTCVYCNGELGPLDTVYCSETCQRAAEGGIDGEEAGDGDEA